MRHESDTIINEIEKELNAELVNIVQLINKNKEEVDILTTAHSGLVKVTKVKVSLAQQAAKVTVRSKRVHYAQQSKQKIDGLALDVVAIAKELTDAKRAALATSKALAATKHLLAVRYRLKKAMMSGNQALRDKLEVVHDKLNWLTEKVTRLSVELDNKNWNLTQTTTNIDQHREEYEN